VAIVLTQLALTDAYDSAGDQSLTFADGAVPTQMLVSLMLRDRYGNYANVAYGGRSSSHHVGRSECGSGSGYARAEVRVWDDAINRSGDTFSWNNAYAGCTLALFGVGSDAGGIISLAGVGGECDHGWSGQIFGPTIDLGTDHEDTLGISGCCADGGSSSTGTEAVSPWSTNGRVGSSGRSKGAYYRLGVGEGSQQMKWKQINNNRRHASVAAAFTEAAGGGAKHQAIIIAS